MSDARIREALRAIARGRPVVVADDADRENEGDLILAARYATPERIAFMVRYTSGVVCVAVPGARLDALELPLMVPRGGDSHGTAFTVSVDLCDGTTTGISAAERAATIRALADPKIAARDFVRPGHVFPLRARPGGVLERRGHTEAASDLARLAGLEPVGVLCELVHDDGTMMRLPSLETFAREHGLVLLHIADIVAFRRSLESQVASAALAAPRKQHAWSAAREHAIRAENTISRRGTNDALPPERSLRDEA